jgi:hypothetical protein
VYDHESDLPVVDDTPFHDLNHQEAVIHTMESSASYDAIECDRGTFYSSEESRAPYYVLRSKIGA